MEQATDLSQGHFDRLTTEHGLANRRVWDILQDRRGFLWFATQNGLNRYDGYEFVAFEHEPGNPRSLSSNYTTHLLEDAAGSIWVGTRADGLNRLDPSTGIVERFRHDAADRNSLINNRIQGLVEDASGHLWIATASGLSRLSPDRQIWEHFFSSETPDSSAQIGGMASDIEGRLWVSIEASLARWEPSTDTFDQALGTVPGKAEREPLQNLVSSADGSLWATAGQRLVRWIPSHGKLDEHPFAIDVPIYSLFEDSTGDLWIATVGAGLFRYEPATGQAHQYRPSATDPHALSDAVVLSIIEDRSGCLWVGTAGRGALKLDRRRELFTRYGHDPAARESLSRGTVRAILEDRQGYLWIGTLGGGLDRMDRQAGTIVHFRHDPGDPSSLSSDTVWELYEDREGIIWVGTESGLGRFDGKSFRNYTHSPSSPEQAERSRVIELYKDADGVLWIATSSGLARLDSEGAHFSPVQVDSQAALNTSQILAIHEGTDGIFWLGTDGEGLLRFDPSSGDVRAFRAEAGSPSGLRDNVVIVIHEESPDILWLGTTSGGLHRFDTQAGTLNVLGRREGMPSDAITGIAGLGSSLWVSTDKGLAEVDLASGRVQRTYGVAAGLLDNGFSSRSFFQSSRGELFFGGPEGVIAFFPDRLQTNPHAPLVAITDLRILNESALPHWRDPESPLERLVMATEVITLSHQDYSFSLAFAGLDFASPSENQYRYKLEGFDKTWMKTNAEHREAHYSNLKPGRYTFRVEASNNDGVWSQEGAQLAVRVLPPWWRTYWAHSLYGLFVAVAVATFLSSQRRKVAQERAVNAELRRLDKLKDDFLANTSHELRTPLQGIIGISESLQDGVAGELPEAARHNLSLVTTSGRRLNRLVDEILDFSKLRTNTLALHLGPVDPRALADGVIELLEPLAQAKGLRLSHRIDKDVAPVLADEERLQQILVNLVGNAIKFTSTGQVEILSRDLSEGLELTVRDSGIGIPPDHLERIFEPFAQAEDSMERSHGGTGLGLSIVKRLVELHGGELRVESRVDEGSAFSFSVPFYCGSAPGAYTPELPAIFDESPPPRSSGLQGSPTLADDLRLELPQVESVAAQEAAAYRILVVDDDPINCQVLLNHLSMQPHYKPVHVQSGEESIAYAKEHAVDLVLLDVMMPGLSGFETCRRLRMEHNLQDLPIIFLTARTQERDEMTGLEAGGNDYLTKPISKGQLLARVETHLELLRRHRQIETLLAERQAEVKVLQGMLPICANCKKIRDDKGYWEEVEVYVTNHSEARFSHSFCPQCVEVFYPGLLSQQRSNA